MDRENKSRSADLWVTTADVMDGTEHMKWHESYYETSADPYLWKRWSSKVAEQMEALKQDQNNRLPNDVIEGRISVIEDLLDDLKLYRKTTADGRTYLAMGRRFL